MHSSPRGCNHFPLVTEQLQVVLNTQPSHSQSERIYILRLCTKTIPLHPLNHVLRSKLPLRLLYRAVPPPFDCYRSCVCGYTLDTTLCTDLLETDFLHLANITVDTDWQPQNYTVSPVDARGPYGKNASLSNVLANPLKSQYDWAGEGVNGGDAGLQLFVRGGIPSDGLIPMAELATSRADLMYGTFRVGMKVTKTSGTCGGFFWVSISITGVS